MSIFVLAGLETKDFFTLFLSFLAIIISVSSYIQKKSENQISLRKQLTEFLEKLTEINLESAKFMHQRLNSKDDLPPDYVKHLNDRRRFLVRQAAFIADKLENKDMVDGYEYLLLANNFNVTDDLKRAEKFFKEAIKSNVKLDRGMAHRKYGQFLFTLNRKKEAEEQFKNALKCFDDENDRIRHFRGDTYERWANLEREWKNNSASENLLKQAADHYQTLDNPAWRHFELKRLNRKPENIEQEKPSTIEQDT